MSSYATAIYQLEANEATALYQTILFRQPSSSEVTYWAARLDSGAETLSQVETAFATSSEAQTIIDPIVRLYQAFFDRAPDAAGLAYWVAKVKGGESLAAISVDFTTSNEFIADYAPVNGAITAANAPSFVQTLYQNVLHRSAWASEVAYWVSVLGSQPTALSTAGVVNGFAQSNEFASDSGSGIESWLTSAANASLALVSSSSAGPAVGSGTYSSGSIAGARTGDVVQFSDAVSLLATHHASATTISWGGADTYTVANGVISFAGSDSDAQLIVNAEGIVNAAGANAVTAFSSNGKTYVVSSGGSANGSSDTVLTLTDMTNVSELGTTAAANTVVIGSAAGVVLSGVTAPSISAAAAHTADDVGYSVQNITGVGTGGSEIIANLGPSAIVNVSATGSFTLVTSQAGTSGSDSLTLALSGANLVISTAALMGDASLVINPTAAATIDALVVDSGTAASSIVIAGSAPFSVAGITDSTLSSVTIADTAAVSLGGATAPLASGNVTVSVTISAAHAVYLGGIGDTIDASSVIFTAVPTLSVSGAGSTVKGGVGAEIIYATGAGDAVTIVADSAGGNVIHVGANTVVTLTTGVTTTSDIVDVSGASAHTGATSTGSYALTTIANAATTGSATTIALDSGSVVGAISAVNATFAASLANALDLAAAATVGAGGVDWFQYAGNTYVVESHAGGTALSAQDAVVKLVGLHDLTGAVVTFAHQLVL
ncbi:DUF4214 domain-containing protein [Telmatospirillum sp.]|uniref:DUF4214 domain-containing protein n=1 Tax=Telmatospirillum sp. TaxID=2079197 RepID=UPI002841B294|nr:DUF4214 domain-containing protein [Telmatospirillum sp.]MDR3438900.1 DUF4214 domain-containing protein [Telmatospirillum sp.]